MPLTISGVETRFTDAIVSAVRDELQPRGIDESRVSLAGYAGPGERVLSLGVVVDGNSSGPMPIETDNFKVSLAAQMDLLRAWLGAGYPAQIPTVEKARYKAGERVHAPDAKGPLVAVRDSQNNRVWVVSEQASKDVAAEPVPYLIFPDGSLVKEQQHGLPD